MPCSVPCQLVAEARIGPTLRVPTTASVLNVKIRPMPDGQQTGADAVTTIAVPPHPRLLSVLGDIEFQPWQCIAELVEAPRRPEGPRLPRGGPSEASDSAA